MGRKNCAFGFRGEALGEEIINTRSLHLKNSYESIITNIWRTNALLQLARLIARQTNCRRQLEKYKSHS